MEIESSKGELDNVSGEVGRIGWKSNRQTKEGRCEINKNQGRNNIREKMKRKKGEEK